MPRTHLRSRRSKQGVQVLAIESDYDKDTRVALQYRKQEVYGKLPGRLKVVPLFGQDATHDQVERAVKRQHFDYLTGQGHGNAETFTGQGGQWIFRLGYYNPKVPVWKIVHLLSCGTAEGLGRDFVQKKRCHAFFGYDIDFVWDECQPDILLSCDAKIDRALAAGRTARQAYDEAMKEFGRRAKELERKGACMTPAALRKIAAHLCAPSTSRDFGRKSARLYRPAR